MAEMLFNWVSDKFASSDIIDLYFVVSDLVDIPLTEAELCETAYFNSLATHAAEDAAASPQGNIPLGKLVL